MADKDHGHGGGSKFVNFGLGLLFIALALWAIYWFVLTVFGPGVSNLNAGGNFRGLTGGSVGQTVTARSGRSCSLVSGATQVRNTSCNRSPGDQQYSWRGRSDYCVPAKPSPNSELCLNSNGALAWFTP